MKCPHCLVEISTGATKCPSCTGDIRYKSASQKMVGLGFKEKLLTFFVMWACVYGLFWWAGNSWFGGANLKLVFWSSLVFAFYAMFAGQAEKS